jgi:hypothetical protein
MIDGEANISGQAKGLGRQAPEPPGETPKKMPKSPYGTSPVAGRRHRLRGNSVNVQAERCICDSNLQKTSPADGLVCPPLTYGSQNGHWRVLVVPRYAGSSATLFADSFSKIGVATHDADKPRKGA